MSDEKDDRRFLTAQEAITLLNDGENIHTFTNPGTGLLFGCDISRERMLQMINNPNNKIEIGGENARAIKHGIVLWENDEGYMFIETNEEKLNAFDPICPSVK